MKHLRNTFVALIVLTLSHTIYAAELGVTEIEVVNNNTIEVTLSENPNLGSEKIDAGVTILNDLYIDSITIDETSENQVLISLDKEISPGMKYSLVTISGTNGSIDFITPDDIAGHLAMNSEEGGDQDIESIEIIDSKNIKVNYKEDLETVISEEFEYKFLLESEVAKIEKKDFMTPVLTITVEPNLLDNQRYILMFIDVQDVDGNYLEFDTGIYDFETENISEIESSETKVISELVEEETPSEEPISTPKEISQENIKTDIVITPLGGSETELNAAPSLQKDSTGWVKIVEDVQTIEEFEATVGAEIGKVQVLEELGTDTSTVVIEELTTTNIQEVAQSAVETPATGAATWVFIVMSLVINAFYYFARRKTYKLV